MDNATELHSLLLAKAKELDLPKAFTRDLTVHDLNALENAPDGTRYAWGIGECGTHMIRLREKEDGCYWSTVIKGMDHWFVIENGQLTPLEKR